MEDRLQEVVHRVFCPFHLPYSSTTELATYGSATNSNNAGRKEDWSPDEIKDFNEDVLAHLDSAFVNSGTCNLAGVDFPVEFDCSNRKLPAVSFKFCCFSGGQANFHGSKFIGPANFHSTQFLSGRFSEIDLEQMAEETPHDEMKHLLSAAVFSDTQFSGFADFSAAQFAGDVTFGAAEFHKGASFERSEFNGEQTDFTKTYFSGDAVRFDDAQFHSTITSFIRAKFVLETVGFNGATFDGTMKLFSGIQFFGSFVSYESTKFSGGLVSFSEAEFPGGVTFSDTAFNGCPLNFDKTVFGGDEISFSTSASNSSVSLDTFAFGRIDFSSAHLHAPANFENRVFQQATDFSNTTFEFAPEFHGCELHQDTLFPPIENFKDTKERQAANAYRTLRLAMKQQEAHEEEAMFWALEQRSKRNNFDLKRPSKWLPWGLSWAYEALSAYGLSETRPLVWLSAWVAVIAPLIYFFLRSPVDQLAKPINYGDILEFSLSQSLRPFFIWGDYDGANIRSELGDNVNVLTLKLFATADSLISLVLIALLILAVRRRFRMQ